MEDNFDKQLEEQIENADNAEHSENNENIESAKNNEATECTENIESVENVEAENVRSDEEQSVEETSSQTENTEKPAEETPVYTDPNEGVVGYYRSTGIEGANNNCESYQSTNNSSSQSANSESTADNETHQYDTNDRQSAGSQHTAFEYDYAKKESKMDTSPMSMVDWLLTILALMIPCVGIILYFVWAFKETGNINRRNFCRAQLIIVGVLLVLEIGFLFVIGVSAFFMALI